MTSKRILSDFWTDRLGYSLVGAVATVLISIAPCVWAYNAYDRTVGLTAWENHTAVGRIEKFAHAFDQWLLIGLALAVAAGLNWFETAVDATGKYKLGWQAGVSTAICVLGGIGSFLFGYISYAGSFSTIEKYSQYFDAELKIYFFGMLSIIFAYFVSIVEIRRTKDRLGG
ncbi:hypothetical protein ACQR10_18010 [Bradyrhizobium sp. HKCCYLRH2060]|uniref:hypothetical protein n=1 Tax=Bradyrhizobium TaxID=374 RepID=UPI002915E1E5|nr:MULTISPECIES: hypothetical protein [unclassified Bradyrhizobium]